MTEGPLKEAFDLLDSDGILSRKLITLRIRDGMLVEETVTRRYIGGDYTDGIKSTPICKVEGEK